jgi:hypothetical protein
MVFRFVDININEVDPDRALETMKRDHPNFCSEGVYATHLYLLTGEIEARDYIDDWFLDVASVKISKGVSRSIVSSQHSDIDESSPILLGNTRTNHLMKEMLRNESERLQFRVDPDRFGLVEVHNAKTHEAQRLRLRYPGNILREGEPLVLCDQPLGVVFAIVTRLPHPSGEGAVTLICSDYTRALGQVARMLTKDEWLSEALKQIDWPLDQSAPPFFEGLLAVHLARGETAKKPHLLAIRHN